MTTVCLQIGNGDDKLSQTGWHSFVAEMKRLVDRHSAKVHFFGAPENWATQQNVAFIFDLEEASIDALQAEVTKLREQFSQESVAWTQGHTRFI